MTWTDAVGIGLGLLSIPVNAVVLYLIHRAIACRWCIFDDKCVCVGPGKAGAHEGRD